jgi:2-keto-4-pentenoate hydratase/2-oxohepta-3-ene-1,7-dioic acid hydratase in catechol pathway
LAVLVSATVAGVSQSAEPTRYCRFQVGDTVAYGMVEGQSVRQLEGDLFGQWSKTDKTHALGDVTLLIPCEPSQVFAMAGNYRSHVAVIEDAAGNASPAPLDQVPEKFRIPQPFHKSLSCLQRHQGHIVIPRNAGPVHYEAEMVIVIGRQATDVSKESALDYVFGVTCGNDVSERGWQQGDVQWWRAKGSDTFGPCGPFIASGLDYDNLRIQLRQNGEVKQDARTSELIHDVATIVSYISQHVTLKPGDLIFTGTSGKTGEIKPGDMLEVELEGAGVLQNRVAADK